ncbi:MAG: Appr-1-p processing protein [Actinomycetota bacterium]
MGRWAIEYVVGDATAPMGDDNKIIVHVCNDIGGWGRGFVLALSARWAAPERAYDRWFEGRDGNDFALGAVQLVPVESDLWVANLIGQRDIYPAADGTPPVRYDAIEQGLVRVAGEAVAREASVHMPRIGSGLAGGRWEEIEPLIERALGAAGVAVTVYDLPTP